MKKAVVLLMVLSAAIAIIAGCSKINSPSSPPQVLAQNIIPLNYGVEALSGGSVTTSAFISGGKCFIVYTEPMSGGMRSDTGFYKKQNADTGYEKITKLEILHVESSYKGLGAGAYVSSAEILLTEETEVVQGQHRYLRYLSGYFSGGNFNIIQDTVILVAMNYGGYYHPYGPYGTSFGEFRSIVLQEGFPNRTLIDGSMTFPHKITVAEEYGAGQFWDQATGTNTDCPTECEHFFRITVGSLGESPMPWNKPRPLLKDIKDSIDLGLCSLLVCKAKVAPIDSAYAELQNGDKTVYFYVRAGSKIWEFFPLYLP